MGGSVHDARVKNFAMHDAQSSKITMHGARNTGVHFCVMNNQVSMSYIPNVAFDISLLVYAMIFVDNVLPYLESFVFVFHYHSHYSETRDLGLKIGQKLRLIRLQFC